MEGKKGREMGERDGGGGRRGERWRGRDGGKGGKVGKESERTLEIVHSRNCHVSYRYSS